MKKSNLAFIIILIGTVSFLSCKKIITKLLPSFDTTIGNIQIAVPAIPIPLSGSVGEQKIYYNLDSTIKAKTGGVFGVSDVSSITLKSLVVTLQNGDPGNNFANFETLRVDLSSNSNGTPVTIASANIPDATSNTLNMDVSNGLNILSYFQGNQLTYNVAGKVRRATFHELDGLVTITVTVK